MINAERDDAESMATGATEEFVAEEYEAVVADVDETTRSGGPGTIDEDHGEAGDMEGERMGESANGGGDGGWSSIV